MASTDRKPQRIYVPLPADVLDAVLVAAWREDREPQAQIVRYVTTALRHDGYLAEPDPEDAPPWLAVDKAGR